MKSEIKTLSEFDSLVAGKGVIVKFSAEWCMPCKRLAPIVSRVCEDMQTELIELDADSCSEVFESFNIRSVPTVIAFFNGEPFGHVLTGIQPEEKYKELCEQLRNATLCEQLRNATEQQV